MTYIWEILLSSPCHKNFVVNMDQMPVFFSLNLKCTLELARTRMVLIRKSLNETKSVTFPMCCNASEKLLKPVLTFKGHPQGRTVRWEFPTYPQEMIYTGQDNAWMNERVILLWAEQVLTP